MAHLDVASPGDPLDDVPIGGEVAVGNGDDLPSAEVAGEIERDVHLLEDADRGRLVDHDLAWARTEQRGQLVADRECQVQPVVFPPRRDQIARPFVDHPM